MGMDRRRSETRIAEVIAEMSVDVVALQEVDLGRQRSAGVDQTKLIAKQLGWHSYFHPAMQQGGEHYGNAILSRHRLTFRRGVELPGTPPFFCRENRAAIEVEIETDIGNIHVINTHLGLGWRERFVQAQLFTSAEWQAGIAGDMPVVLVGDFNSLRGSRPYRTLNRHLRDVRELIRTTAPIRTFPTRFPVLAVDHIFVNHPVQPVSLTVHRSPLARIASDHFPLMAEFVRSPRSSPSCLENSTSQSKGTTPNRNGEFRLQRSKFSVFFSLSGDRKTGRIRFKLKEEKGAIFTDAASSVSGVRILSKTKSTGGRIMKKLLLLPLIAIALALVPVKQADAQVSVGVGPVGIGFGYPAYGYSYYGYPGYGYYPRGYHSYYGGYPYNRTYYYNGRPYYHSGHRYHKHYKRYYRY